jgi:hypothetical protein
VPMGILQDIVRITQQVKVGSLRRTHFITFNDRRALGVKDAPPVELKSTWRAPWDARFAALRDLPVTRLLSPTLLLAGKPGAKTLRGLTTSNCRSRVHWEERSEVCTIRKIRCVRRAKPFRFFHLCRQTYRESDPCIDASWNCPSLSVPSLRLSRRCLALER